MSNSNPPDMHAVMERFFALADKVKEARKADGRTLSGPTLTEFVTAMHDLDAAITRQAMPAADGGSNATPEEISRLCATGLRCLAGTSAIAEAAGLQAASEEIDRLVFPFSLWMAARGAELSPLEPVVNAVAVLANAQRDPAELKALYADLTLLLEAVPTDGDEATQPWRLLLLNRAIVATRSLDPVLMEEAFDSVLLHLPADAERFFEEGMGQMDVIGYPGPVREVMRRYHQRTLAPKTLH